jgi:ATP-dependent 26S proteasome regulatory subunit
MGILDDFIRTIKGQTEQYQKEQRKAVEEKARLENKAKLRAAQEKAAKEEAQRRAIEERSRLENEARIKAAREGKAQPSDRGVVGEISERVKEQRRQFEEAQKGGKPASAPTQVVQEQRPAEVSAFRHTFRQDISAPARVWFDDNEKAVYIDDIDEFMKSAPKIEVRGIKASEDPDMYNIYTNKGGPNGQARYYRPNNVIVSSVPDPFTKYR